MSATQTKAESHSLYGGEIIVEFNEGNHRYRIGKDYKYGVTTALSVLSKDNLIQWASTMAADSFRTTFEREKNHINTVVWDSMRFEEIYTAAKYAHRTRKDDAADVGKRVHQWISEYIKDNYCVPVDEVMAPSIDAFLEWEHQAKPEYLHSERVVYSKAHDYCGTVDLVMNLDGKRVVADLKTGKPEQEYKKTYTGRQRGRAEHFLQNGAYDQALGEEDGVWADSVAVIYLPLDGSIHVYQHDNPEFWRKGFLSVLETFRVLKSAGQLNEFQEVA